MKGTKYYVICPNRHICEAGTSDGPPYSAYMERHKTELLCHHGSKHEPNPHCLPKCPYLKDIVDMRRGSIIKCMEVKNG